MPVKTEPTVKTRYEYDYEFTTTSGEKFTKRCLGSMFDVEWMLRQHSYINNDEYNKIYNTKYITDVKQIAFRSVEYT